MTLQTDKHGEGEIVFNPSHRIWRLSPLRIRFRGGHLFVLLVGGEVEEFDVKNLSKIRKVGQFDESELSVSGSMDEDAQATLGDSMWLPDVVELHSFVDDLEN